MRCWRAWAWIVAALLGLAGSARAVEFTRANSGDWQVAGPGYSAVIAKDGYLTSLKVGDVETIGEPLAYQRNAKLVANKFEPSGDTLKVHLKGNGEATIEYVFRADGLSVIPTYQGNGFAEFRLVAAKQLLGIELLNDKSVCGGGDTIRFVERGEIRGVPALASSRNQMIRLHFPGFALHAYVQAWGAPFNYESAGAIQGFGWGRSLMDAKKPFPIIFTIGKGANAATLPAVPFVPRTEKVASLYYADEPCVWNIDLGERKAYQYLLDAGVKALDVAWTATDFHDKVVASGTDRIELDAAGAKTIRPVTIKAGGSGYHQVLFALSDPAGKMLASSFLTRFTVIHKVPGMINRDDSLAGKNLTDYAVIGMIGIGANRESHDVKGFFTNQQPQGAEWVKVDGAEPAVWMNTRRLDEIINRAAEESAKYKLEWFLQANGRPKWATPAMYEAMAYAMVSRYKDRCHAWEVENEPNFGYKPQEYFEQCVIPFHKGAKRADPNCIIMGPATVSLSHTLRFMEYAYANGGNKYFDNLSTHTYPGPGESWERFGNISMLNKLRQWMGEHGDGGKALWQTEQGYMWNLSPKGQAARYAVRQFLTGWRLGIEPRHQYYFYPQWGGFESWYVAGGGEAGSERSWLPIASAQRILAEETAGMKFAGDVSSPYKGIYICRLSGEKEDVAVAWTLDFAFDLAARAPGVRSVHNFMGNEVAARPDGAGKVALRLSGEPVYIHLEKGSAFEVTSRPFGANLALASVGAVATASSEAKNRPATNANDGLWELWEKAADLPARTTWQSARKDPTPENPDWLQITFAAPRKIDRMVALCYLPAVNPSPREFEFQAEVDGQWKTVASGKDEYATVLYREFAPVTTSKVRLVIKRINDGWHGDRRWMHVLMGPQAKNYTDSQIMVSELEAYSAE